MACLEPCITLAYSEPYQIQNFALREVSKYGVFSGLYFPVFKLSTGKYGPEKTPYLDTFHAIVSIVMAKGVAKRCHDNLISFFIW